MLTLAIVLFCLSFPCSLVCYLTGLHLRRCNRRLADENLKLRLMIAGFTRRISEQSELLSRRAEREQDEEAMARMSWEGCRHDGP